jgi:hypothetical protein
MAEGSFGTSVYTYPTAGVTRLEDNNFHSHHSAKRKDIFEEPAASIIGVVYRLSLPQ